MAERRNGPVGGLKDTIVSHPATDRLKEAASAYAGAQAQRLLVSTGRKLGEATSRLTDVAEGRDTGLTKLAEKSGRKFAEGKGPLRSVLEIGAGSVKDKARGRAKDALQNVGGGRKSGGGKGRSVTISEQIDVGVPVREAYNQWTQFQEFSTFTKGVQGVETTDDVQSDWRAKIFWSSRTWKATTTEQIPDERIAWTSEGAKGTLRGVVTFHALTDSLTRVLLVIEYHPGGLFEKTGNIWRAQGRRARLDLKHFRRFVMLRGEATGEWRGEIRDGEVVRSHEEAVEAEQDVQDVQDAHGRHGDDESAEEPEDADAYEEDAYEEEAYEEDAEEEPGEPGDSGEEYAEEADEDAREREPERIR